jgi:hypothetical protein
MMATVKTNPAYAALAYRRTIIHSMIIFLKRDFVGLDAEPSKKLICEEVLAADSEVPVEEIAQYLEELEREHHNLTFELGKFEFTKKSQDNVPKQQQAQKKGHQGR